MEEQHKIKKRDKILLAAEHLFAKLGYEGTSTRQIAKESGVNMAMINYYFGSKEGVFIEIMTTNMIGFRMQLDLIHQENVGVDKKLLLVIDKFIDRVFCNIPFHKMMHRELLLSQRPEMFVAIKEVIETNLNIIERLILQGISEGVFRPVDARMSVFGVFSIISSTVLSPFKITGEETDLSNEIENLALKKRLKIYLEDLVITHLTPIK